MKRIPLTNGGYALVDDEDYERVVAAGHWFAWTNTNGMRYAARSFGRANRIDMHRYILGLRRGDGRVDHLNGNTLDNQRWNLRRATASQNARNIPGAQKNSQSGVRGVSPGQDGKWEVRLGLNGKRLFIGYFDTIDEARAARAAAERKHWSEADRTRARLKEQGEN